LAVAWLEVAGEALAGRAEAVRVSRGTLEVQVDERRWEVTVRDLLPRLAARLARLHPSLGVRRCRLLVQEGGSVRKGEAVALEDEELRAEPGAQAPSAISEKPRSNDVPTGENLAERLARLGERYLERAEQRRVRKRSAQDPERPSDPG
jgi:hypothetical protein